MSDNFRQFEVGPDPYGATWSVEFMWSQNAISIRHADTVDCKFGITSGELHEEKVVAVPQTALLKASKETGHAITDGWVCRIAAAFLRKMIETGDDMERSLVTMDAATVLALAESGHTAVAAGH